MLGPARPDGLVPAELYGARGLVPVRYLEPVGAAAPRTRLLAQLGSSHATRAATLPAFPDHAGASLYRQALYVARAVLAVHT